MSLSIPAANSSPQRLLPVGSADARRAPRRRGRRLGTGKRSRQRHRGREHAWERGLQRCSSKKGRAGLGSRLRPGSPMRASAPRGLSRLTGSPASPPPPPARLQQRAPLSASRSPLSGPPSPLTLRDPTRECGRRGAAARAGWWEIRGLTRVWVRPRGLGSWESGVGGLVRLS